MLIPADDLTLTQVNHKPRHTDTFPLVYDVFISMQCLNKEWVCSQLFCLADDEMFADTFKVKVSPDSIFYEVEGKVGWLYTITDLYEWSSQEVISCLVQGHI